MEKIAIVVQRCAKDIVGGSENYALKLGEILSEKYNVEIITTRAKDHVTWKNHYKEDLEVINNNLIIKRFKVDFIRSKSLNIFNRILFKKMTFEMYNELSFNKKNNIINKIEKLPLGIAEEWVKENGPYSSNLFAYLNKKQKKYKKIIFITYLYATTYFGVDYIKDKNKVIIIPTYHDEIPVFLNIFKKYIQFKHFFLTNAEKELAEKIIFKRKINNRIIGFGIKDRYKENNKKKNHNEKYILYAGRLEKAKRVDMLIKYFQKFYTENNSIKLYMIGTGILGKQNKEGIVFKGFVTEKEKYNLMQNALCFVHPSALESFGIVLIESFMMNTPVLVNGNSNVLKEHVNISKGGFYFNNYKDFFKKLKKMLYSKEIYNNLCLNARKYYLDNYEIKIFKEKIYKYIEF